MEHLLDVRTTVRNKLLNNHGIQQVLAGSPSRELYIRYLINVYKYAQHSPVVIAMAGARCTGSHPELSRYLLHHADEELGHDRWALADLQELGVTQGEADAADPVPACTSMIGVVYYAAAHANPISLFGWLYVLEAMGDDLGTQMARHIDEGLGLDGRALRFLAGHGVNDVEHTADLTEMISRHVNDADDMRDVNHIADVVGDLYVRIFDELAAET